MWQPAWLNNGELCSLGLSNQDPSAKYGRPLYKLLVKKAWKAHLPPPKLIKALVIPLACQVTSWILLLKTSYILSTRHREITLDLWKPPPCWPAFMDPEDASGLTQLRALRTETPTCCLRYRYGCHSSKLLWGSHTLSLAFWPTPQEEINALCCVHRWGPIAEKGSWAPGGIYKGCLAKQM